MKELLEWLMKTPCQKGKHKFVEFLLSSKLTDRTVKARGIDIEDFKDKTYEIRCQHCGKTPQEVNHE